MIRFRVLPIAAGYPDANELRVAAHQANDDGVPMTRSGVAPGKGQKVAVVEIDRAWHDRPLADIHQHFVVAPKGSNATLRERGPKG